MRRAASYVLDRHSVRRAIVRAWRALGLALAFAACERTVTLPGRVIQSPGRVDTLYRDSLIVVIRHDTTVVQHTDTVTVTHTDTVNLSKLPQVACLFITTGDTLAALSWRDSPYCAAEWQSRFVDTTRIHVVMNVDRVCMRLGSGPWPDCSVPPGILPGFLKSH